MESSQSVSITIDHPPTEVLLYVDRHQIHQLLLNLILNAMDELPQGGKICVSVTPLKLSSQGQALSNEDPPVHDFYDISEHQALRMRRSSLTPAPPKAFEWLSLRVTDSGSGIPPKILKTIFEPFVTTKETGTGLGLTISQRIVASHQGTIKASNCPAGGAQENL